MNAGPAPLIHVAVLDDDYDFLHYIADFLKDEQIYEVRTFAHPEDFFDSCGRRLPDIVLLDMKMGKFHGEEVLDRLLASWPKLCIIVVTGYPSLEQMRATFKRKVFDYLVKPFSLAQLRQTLQHAIDAYGLGRSDPERFRQSLGHTIRVLRIERDWSLKDLADATKLSVSQISSIERGSHFPSMESLLAICRAFKLRPSEILSSIGY
jgi:two-component system OmpR family response regulator